MGGGLCARGPRGLGCKDSAQLGLELVEKTCHCVLQNVQGLSEEGWVRQSVTMSAWLTMIRPWPVRSKGCVNAAFGWLLQTVLIPAKLKRFVVLPKRWIVERTFGWLGCYRRHSKDYERNTASSEAMI
jgi:transposase